MRRPPGSRPDGVFAVNDLSALGILQVLIASGVRVPQEVAIVGFDDIEYGESSIVPLSSIRPPHEEFGIMAVDLLLQELGEGTVEGPRQVVFPPELVVRESSTAAGGTRREAGAGSAAREA